MLTVDCGSFANTKNPGILSGGFFTPFWMEFSPIIDNPIVSIITAPVYNRDRIQYTTTSSASTNINWTYSIDSTRPPLPIQRISGNNSIISPDPNNPYNWIGNSIGTTTITLSTPIQSVTHTVSSIALNAAVGTSLHILLVVQHYNVLVQLIH